MLGFLETTTTTSENDVTKVVGRGGKTERERECVYFVLFLLVMISLLGFLGLVKLGSFVFKGQRHEKGLEILISYCGFHFVFLCRKAYRF